MYLMIEDMKTMSLQSGDKRHSFNLKRENVVIIFSDDKMFTRDAEVFVEMTDTCQSY